MDARDFVNDLTGKGWVLWLEHYVGESCDGRGYGVVIDDTAKVAVMVTDCGDANETKVRCGAIVRFSEHPEAAPKIIGEPAYIR